MPARISRLALPAVLCAFLFLAIGYSVVVPLGEAPDEVSHWAYVQYLVEHHSLPTPQGAVLGESHQPPLYYLLGALATFWIPQPAFEPIANPDFAFENAETPHLLLHTRREEFPYQGAPLAWHLLRLLSVVMGAVTIWTTWQIAHEFLPNEPLIALGAAAFVAFLPAFTFLSAVVNNDNLIIMLSGLSVWQAVKLARRPATARQAALLGVLLGLAALTKLSGLVVWLFASAVLGLIVWRTRRLRQVVIYGVTCFGIALALTAPLAVYNWVHYGDPLAWSLAMAATPIRSSPISLDDWRVVLWGLFTSFWGRFGGALHLRMADALYIVLGAIAALAVAGWVRWARAKDKAALPSGMTGVLAAFGAFWFLMLAAFVRWTLAVLGTDQARQLFPGLPLFALVFTLGLAWLWRSRQTAVLTAAYCGLLVLNVTVLAYLGSTFAGAAAQLDSLVRLGGANAPVNFGNKVRVVDYAVQPTHLTAGGTIDVQLQWQAASDVDRSYWMLLQLADKNGSVANKDASPAAGRPTTDWWQAGQVFTSHHRFQVPQDLAPGTYVLRLGLHPFGVWEWLPVRGQDTIALSTIEVTPAQ